MVSLLDIIGPVMVGATSTGRRLAKERLYQIKRA
jgi:hypothetical protein